MTSDPLSFCKEGAAKSARFNDSGGFSNVAIRDGGYIKVYREVASPDLDWAVYDSYVFSPKGGSNLFFSRAVIYAGNPIVYVLTKDESGQTSDNKLALPDGFYVPDEPLLSKLDDFCNLSVKVAGAR
jgi:hypothetical protein